MSAPLNLVNVTAADLAAGDDLYRVMKTPGRTRVFEAPIDSIVESATPSAEYPGYVTVVLDNGTRRLNLEATRGVIINIV